MHDPGKAARDAMEHARRSNERAMRAANEAIQRNAKMREQAEFQRKLADEARKRRQNPPHATGSAAGGLFGRKKAQQRSTGIGNPAGSHPTFAQQPESFPEQRYHPAHYSPRSERSLVGKFFQFLFGLIKIALVIFMIGVVLTILLRRH